MSTPYCEKVDVFLPGKGESLLATPDYHWERAEGMVGLFFFSTRDPNTVLITPAGSTREQKRRLAQARIVVDHTNQQFHDLDGFGVHIPGLLVTAQGTAIAVCQRRHDSTSDGRTAKDILLSASTPCTSSLKVTRQTTVSALVRSSEGIWRSIEPTTGALLSAASTLSIASRMAVTDCENRSA